MGYIVKMFEEINRLKLLGNKVLDVGSQDLTIFSKTDLESINQFILSNNRAGGKIELNQCWF